MRIESASEDWAHSVRLKKEQNFMYPLSVYINNIRIRLRFREFLWPNTKTNSNRDVFIVVIIFLVIWRKSSTENNISYYKWIIRYDNNNNNDNENTIITASSTGRF